MVHEKIFKLAIGREAKIIMNGYLLNNSVEIAIEFEFLLKDSHEKYFRDPIGVNHPRYWKLKRSDQEKSQLLQLQYSGISKKQLSSAIEEFKQLMGPGFTFSYKIKIEETIKGLKGIRVGAQNRRLLTVA